MNDKIKQNEQDPRRIPQIEFETIEEFIEKQNNFYCHFVRNGWGEKVYRPADHFRRFQQAYPEFEREVSDETTRADMAGEQKPWEKMWEAYKLMSQFVYVCDEAVMVGGKPDKHKLLR